MAGILDNEFMKVLLSGSPYMKSRQEDAIRSRRTNAFADEWGGILGSKPQAVTRIDSGSHPGLLSSEEISPQYQVMEGGSGYMGGEMNKQEYDQRVALAHARQFANPNMASNIFTQDMSGRQAYERNKYNQTHLSANDIRNQQNTDRAYLTDQIDQGVQNLEIGNQLIAGLPKLGNTDVIDYGNMNATQDNQMLMAFAKIINPGEAVGVDEKGAIQGAAWMPEFLMRGIAAVQSGGEMPDALRNQIAQQYTQALQMNMEKVQQLRQMNSNVSGAVYSPQPQNYRGMYTGGQVGNSGIFDGMRSTKTKNRKVTDDDPRTTPDLFNQ